LFVSLRFFTCQVSILSGLLALKKVSFEVARIGVNVIDATCTFILFTHPTPHGRTWYLFDFSVSMVFGGGGSREGTMRVDAAQESRNRFLE
jgi:hypothetical protein